MTKRESQARNTVANRSRLQAELAELEIELLTAVDVQDHANQASIWTFNAWGASDAFISRTEHDKLIKRLEQLSYDADTLKADSDALVRRLRERKQALTSELGVHVREKQMNTEREKIEKKAVENVKAQVEAHSATSKTVTNQKAKNDLTTKPKKQNGKRKAA